jgi:peptidoglycan/LPS O-acetylase OafA/YrhL
VPRTFSIPKPRTLTPAASAHLDLIRAVAAWAVMWGHVRAHFFVDFQHMERGGIFVKALYFLTGFGHQAVMVFFVLSGFLISASVMGSQMDGRWSWREYGINRVSRLYVVLIPGLLLGLLWDKAGSTLFASTGIYSHPLAGFGPAVVKSQLTLPIFIGNALFVQTIVCPTFGSNGPLWSLSNEFWYYVLFPMGLLAGVAWARRTMSRAIPLTILALGLIYFLGLDKAIGFLVWLAGCGLVLAYSRIQSAAKRWLIPYAAVSALALAGCLVCARTQRFAPFGTDLAVGIAFALFLFAVLYVELGARSARYHEAARFFAGFSYSLYVLHFPFLLFLRAWIAPWQRWQPDARHLVYGAALGAAALTFAWAVSLVTENQTHAVRSWMRNAIPRTGGGESRA